MKNWIHYTLVFLGVGAVLAGTRILDVRWRASKERNASTLLRTLATTEDCCRGYDRDWSHVITPTPEQKAVRLIEISVASADSPFQWPASLDELVFWVEYWRRKDPD